MYAAKLRVVFVFTCAVSCVSGAGRARADEADDQFNAAAQQYSVQHWDLAADGFRAFAREHPYNAKRGKATYYLGEALVQLGRYTDAYPVFIDLLADQPTGPYSKHAMFRAGEAALLSGKIDEARVRLSQFRILYPDDKLNALVLMYQADLAVKSGDAAEATQLYRESLTRFADQPCADECRLNLAHTLAAQKQTDAATSLLRDIAQRDHSPWTEMALLELGDDAAAMGRNQQAFELYDSIVQRFPNGPLILQAQLGRGVSLYQLGRYEDAQRSLAEAASNKDLAPEARHWLVQSQKAQKQWNAAADTLSAALQNRAKSDVASPGPSYTAPEPAAETSAVSARRDSPRKIVESNPAQSQRAAKTSQEPTLAHPPTAVVDDKPAAPADADAEVSVEIVNDVAAGKPPAQKHVAAEKTAAEKAAVVDEQQRRRAAVSRFQTAEAMIRAGDFRRAIGTLQVVDDTADDPPSLANRYLLAVALQGAKRNDEAMATLRELIAVIDNKLATIATDRSDEPAAASDPVSKDDLTALHSLRANVLLAQATSLVAAEQFAQAIEPLQQYLTIGRQDVGAERASSALVVCFARTNHLDEARKALDDFRAKYPNSTMTLPITLQVADAAYLSGQHAIAADLFTTLSADGNPPEMMAKGLAGLGWSRAKLGDYEAADRVFAQFLERYPTDPNAAGAALARGQALEHLGRDSAAATVYRQALVHYRNAPQLSGLLSAAAHLHDRLGEDEEAIQMYQRLAREFPNSPEVDAALYGWAWALRDMGRGNESDKIFRQIHREHPTSPFWADATYRLAERASQHGNRAAATELLRPLLNGDCPPAVLEHALYLQAQIAIGERHWIDAEPPLQRLIAEFPKGELALAAEFWFAEIAYRTDDFDTAKKRFDELAQHISNHVDRWTAIVPLRRAQLMFQQKHWPEARELAETITRDYPDFDQQYEADCLIGRCLMAEKSYDAARAAFGRVVHSAAGGKTETAAMAQWMTGDAYFQQENYSAALREYMRVEIMYPYPHWQSAALLQAGKCYEKLGQNREAAELYARMMEKYPQTEFTADASQRLQNTTRK